MGPPLEPLHQACAPGRNRNPNPTALPRGVTVAGPDPHQSFMVLRTRLHRRTCTRVCGPTGTRVARLQLPFPGTPRQAELRPGQLHHVTAAGRAHTQVCTVLHTSFPAQI